MFFSALFFYSTRQMSLQRARFDSGLFEFVRCARRGRKALHLVAIPFRRVSDRGQRSRLARSRRAFKRRHLVAARKDFFDRRALAGTQMRVLVLDFPARLERPERRVLLLARTHELDIVALEPDHLFRGKRPPWLVFGARRFDQLSGFHALVKSGP